MSTRETIFQAVIAALTGAGLTVQARRAVPTSDGDLPVVLAVPGDTTRELTAYDTVTNRLSVTLLVVGTSIEQVEATAATALTALAGDAALAGLVESADIGTISEDTELLQHQITHQRIDYMLSYTTDPTTY